jgi:hypothetical protein
MRNRYNTHTLFAHTHIYTDTLAPTTSPTPYPTHTPSYSFAYQLLMFLSLNNRFLILGSSIRSLKFEVFGSVGIMLRIFLLSIFRSISISSFLRQILLNTIINFNRNNLFSKLYQVFSLHYLIIFIDILL